MLDKTEITKAAQKYTAKGQIDKAIAEWEKLSGESQDGNVFNIIGDLQLKRKAKREALDAFEKAATIFRDDGFYLKAMAMYKKILNLAPLDVKALIALGELNAEKGLIGNANENFLAVAKIYIQDGAAEKALDIYEKILKLSPFNMSIKVKIMELYLKIGLKNEAVKECLDVAVDYFNKGEYSQAQEFYLKIIGIDQQNAPALIGLSRVAENEGNIKQAYEYINNAMSFAYDNRDVLFHYSRLCVKTDNVDRAKETLTKLITLDPSNNEYKKLLGSIYLNEGLFEKAWNELLPYIDDALINEKWDEALELLVGFQEREPLAVKRRLSTIYKGKGDKQAAVRELKAIAEIYEGRQLLKEALQSYKEVLELDPDDHVAGDKIKNLGMGPGIAAAQPEPTVKAERSAEDILLEVDTFVRHGMLDEAIGELEKLKLKEPANAEIHTRLKDMYIGSGDRDKAIGECMLLSEIYEKLGDLDKRNCIISEAADMDPNDPRISSARVSAPEIEEAEEEAAEEKEPAVIKAKESFEDKLAEGDFYAQQGLKEEAIKIYEELLLSAPDRRDVTERLHALRPPEKLVKKPARTSEQQAVDGDLRDIFDEFKKGIEDELGDKDHETRYNLGIAYREMGLLEDAIREFQVAAKDPGRAIQSSSMLALCYMDKKQYPLAIDEYQRILKSIVPTDRNYLDYLGVKCDMADAYVKNGEFENAIKLYMEVYEKDPGFRDVASKVEILKKRGTGEKEEKKPKSKKDRVSYI